MVCVLVDGPLRHPAQAEGDRPPGDVLRLGEGHLAALGVGVAADRSAPDNLHV